MQNIIPALRITDYEDSKDFYVRRLGFTVEWEHRFESDYPVFMKITKDGLSLFLTEHENDCAIGSLVFLYVDDVDAWYRLCFQHGIIPEVPPNDKPWGSREMRFYDPDGNSICIASRLQPS